MAYGGILKDKDCDRWVPDAPPFRWPDSEWLQGPMVMGRLYVFQDLRDRRRAVPSATARLVVRIAEGRVASARLTCSSGDPDLDRLLLALYDGAEAPFSSPAEYAVQASGTAPASAALGPIPPGTKPRVAPSWPVDWIDGPVVDGREDILTTLAALREAHDTGSVWLRLEVQDTRVTQVRVALPSTNRAFDDAAVALFTDAELAPSPHWTAPGLTAAQVAGRRRDLLPDDFDFDD